MKAKLTNNNTGVSVIVRSTTEHPCSSYGQPVWVDENNQAYCQVGFEAPFYNVELLKIKDQPDVIKQLKELCKTKNILELAEATGVSHTTIYRTLNGTINPSLSVVVKLANALGKTLELK